MSNIETINGFWIGENLTPIGVLSIKSFLYLKHNYILWSYEKIKNLPKNAIPKDASDVVDRNIYNKWFGKNVIHPSSLQKKRVHQSFADYFRLKLLYKYGGWWCDTDIVALKTFDFEQEYVFSWGKWPCKWMTAELKHKIGINYSLNNGTLKCPKGCKLIKNMLDSCEKKAERAEFPNWGEWNHQNLTNEVYNLSLQKYIFKDPVFEPYGEESWHLPFTKKINPPTWAYALHLYNSKNIKNSKFNTMIDVFKIKYETSPIFY